MPDDLKVGDTVELPTISPSMTVTHIYTEAIGVCWFPLNKDDSLGDLKLATFPRGALVKVMAAEEPAA